jgi:Mn-dependent DtxR family transcriptional regulator
VGTALGIEGNRYSAMTEPRVAVLEQLGQVTDPSGDRTTTIETIADSMDLEEGIAQKHVQGLQRADLVTVTPDGGIRITITGEQFLELDVEDVVVVRSADRDSEQ